MFECYSVDPHRTLLLLSKTFKRTASKKCNENARVNDAKFESAFLH